MYSPNYILILILNLLTLFTINLLFIWYESLYLYCFFKKTCLENARHAAIYEMKTNKEVLKNITDLKTIIIEGKSTNLFASFCDIDILISPEVRVFHFENICYIYNTKTNEFVELNFQVNTLQQIMNLSVGLLDSEVTDLRNLFGKCELSIDIPSFFKLSLKELSNPFYVFQIFSVILWFFEDYITYSLLIVVATGISLFMSVRTTRENLENIKKMANTNCQTKIYRRNDVQKLNTRKENLLR